MNEKQKMVMEELFDSMGDSHRAIFEELTEYAISLGYNPVRNKTHDVTIDFRNNCLKKTIMKMEAQEQRHDGCRYGERKYPGLRLRFYASNDYSELFRHGIRRVIEEFDGKYAGCYGCGRCDGTEGYTYVYPDGRQVYRCGSELISVFNFTEQDLPEIKKLLRHQAEYYEQRIQ